MTLISTNVYINILHDLANKYNNTYHITIKNEACPCKIKYIY